MTMGGKTDTQPFFANSPYAAELERGASLRFTAKVEAEYVRARLLGNRTLIRAACTFAAALALFRGAEQLWNGGWSGSHMLVVAFIVASSAVLALVVWNRRAFERIYLPLATIVAPVRNAFAAICIVEAAALDHVESLMVLPLMVLGPFFFLGLRFGAAFVTTLAGSVAFVAAAIVFDLDTTVAVQACVFLATAVVASVVAARHLEKAARKSFLESRLIADLAHHDALTGLKNRRVFDEHLGELWQRGIDDGGSIAILLFDVDHFKAYNDLYGHQAGDRTLRRVAQTLQRFVTHPQAVVARYGGEEFAVVLSDVESAEAHSLADRMRRAVSELGIEHRESRAGSVVTISVGVAMIAPSRDRHAPGALQLADQALYEAKVRGRNRVAIMDQAAHGLLVTGVFSKAELVQAR